MGFDGDPGSRSSRDGHDRHERGHLESNAGQHKHDVGRVERDNRGRAREWMRVRMRVRCMHPAKEKGSREMRVPVRLARDTHFLFFPFLCVCVMVLLAGASVSKSIRSHTHLPDVLKDHHDVYTRNTGMFIRLSFSDIDWSLGRSHSRHSCNENT